MVTNVQSVRARIADHAARIVFLVCAILLIVVILSVFGFLGANAFRIFFEKGGTSVKDFFFSTNWDPTGNNGNPSFGAGGLILGSVIITAISVIIVIPLAFGTALCFTQVFPRWLANLVQPLIEIFSGMPSVVIGFLGLIVLVPFLTKLAAPIDGGIATGGFGWAAAIIVLIVMILPIVTSVSIDAFRAVPDGVREASFALGSTKWQTMIHAIIPAVAPALGTAVVLGLARAIGETLAVSMVLGGGSATPQHLLSLAAFFQPNTNITNAIVLDFQETYGASRDAYWTLAFVLLLISFLFICISRYLASRSVYK
jgi:phosphate transport system permease protein